MPYKSNCPEANKKVNVAKTMEGDKFHTGLNEVWTLKKINEPNVIKIVMN